MEAKRWLHVVVEVSFLRPDVAFLYVGIPVGAVVVSMQSAGLQSCGLM